jgi:hypothetical protein
MFNEQDKGASTPEEISELKARIMRDAPAEFTMQDIYSWDDVPDLTLYVALHQLLEEGLLSGTSMYGAQHYPSHDDYHYRRV